LNLDLRLREYNEQRQVPRTLLFRQSADADTSLDAMAMEQEEMIAA
jgi:hypothetical protein